MAQKKSKKLLSKGERLGWTPMDKVQKIVLSSVVVRGRRVARQVHTVGVLEETAANGFFIA